MSVYDVAVLGGGPGGCAAALRAAARGAKTCLIEARLVGGTCLNVGCIPTKAMLHGAQLAWRSAAAGSMGLAGEGLRVDGPAFMKRTASVVGIVRKGLEGLLKGRQVDVIAGRGRLTGPGQLSLTGPDGRTAISAGAVIIATGSRPARPGFAPWGSPRVMTTDEATTAGDLPGSVLIVGGGVIGCEFATLYAELGVRTHLVEALPGLLGNIDPDAARIVARSLRRRKVKVTTSAEIVAMSADEEGVSAELADGTHIGAEVALVAVGREPNVEDIGLESVGIELTDGIIPVDEHCRTAVEGVYAVGDVAERMQYAHLAARMGVVAADNATGHEHSDDRAVVPECIYTHPEVAAVGLRKVRLATAAGKVRTAMFPLQASGMARACGQTDGLVKLFGHAETGEVLGGVVVAPRATDMIAEIALAARCGLKVEDLAETIHAHPSFCESVRSAAESWLGLGIDTLE